MGVMVSKQEIAEWFDRGVQQRATHLIVVCDTFDWDDYPVLVMPGENVKDKYSEYHDKNMQTVMEVYNLSLDKNEQLEDRRVFNF